MSRVPFPFRAIHRATERTPRTGRTLPVESQLFEKHRVAYLLLPDDTERDEHRNGDGEIERGAGFRDVRRGQRRKIKASSCVA